MPVIARLRPALCVAFLCLACGPKEVAKADGKAKVVGAFAGRVYWVEGETLAWMDDTLKQPRRFHITGVDWADSSNFAVDASGIYFSHHNGVMRLEREPKEDGIDGDERQAGEHPSGIHVEGACVYTLDADVYCQDAGSIVALPKDAPAPCVSREVPANGLQPVSFQMDAGHFYWIDGFCGDPHSRKPVWTVKALPRRTPGLTVVATAERGAEDLRVGTQGLYWRSVDGLRFAAHGAKPTTIAPAPVTSVVVDGKAVFFTKPDGVYSLEGRIVEQRDPKDLVADDRYLYWRTADRIFRRRR